VTSISDFPASGKGVGEGMGVTVGVSVGGGVGVANNAWTPEQDTSKAVNTNQTKERSRFFFIIQSPMSGG
jgi:hypothetical protein